MKNIFLFFILFSCATVKYNIDNYDIELYNSNISNILQKKIYNELINNSSIIYNKDSDYLLKISINKKSKTSLYSKNISDELYNIKYIINYIIINKINNNQLTKNKIIVYDDKFIAKNRFANYMQDEYINDNFIKSLISKLEEKLKN